MRAYTPFCPILAGTAENTLASILRGRWLDRHFDAVWPTPATLARYNGELTELASFLPSFPNKPC
jgi:hypothetical protein